MKPLLNQEEMDSLVAATTENHAQMMEQDWTLEQKCILTENLAAVRAAADALRPLLNALPDEGQP